MAERATAQRSDAVPRNVKGIFVAEFLVREGNTMVYTYPEKLPVDGFEWRVLPSGGHEVISDVIHFACGGASGDAAYAVAVFRARRLSAQDAHQEQLRGVRSLSVGVVLGTSAD